MADRKILFKYARLPQHEQVEILSEMFDVTETDVILLLCSYPCQVSKHGNHRID